MSELKDTVKDTLRGFGLYYDLTTMRQRAWYYENGQKIWADTLKPVEETTYNEADCTIKTTCPDCGSSLIDFKE